jgi:hypothetical protein
MYMNMEDYPTFFTLTQIKIKEHRFYRCFTFHSHSGVFSDEHNSYPQMCVYRLQVCSRYELFTSVNKRYIDLKVLPLTVFCKTVGIEL